MGQFHDSPGAGAGQARGEAGSKGSRQDGTGSGQHAYMLIVPACAGTCARRRKRTKPMLNGGKVGIAKFWNFGRIVGDLRHGMRAGHITRCSHPPASFSLHCCPTVQYPLGPL